jgi:aldehyde:ferredoxin oxidoreductase
MSGGYMGKALDIDLTRGTVTELHIPAEDRRLYLGGKGLATRLLYDHTPPGMDPFDEAMPLIFATGPVTGTAAPQSNRFVVTTKSPLTGAVGSSTCGGNFATKLKKAGVDVVLLRGKAKKPVYVEITEGGVEIKDAKKLWGLGAAATQAALPKAFGKAVIGPAGENKVRFAAIVSEERIAGRCGVGAVMGSKNLKAVIANGRVKTPIEDKEAFKALQKSHTKFLLDHPMTGDVLPKLGTANIVMSAAGRGILPVRNFSAGTDLEAPKLSGEKMADEDLVKQVGCTACPIICGRGLELIKEAGEELEAGDDAPKKKRKKNVTKGPEYETIGLMGSNLGCFDLKKVYEWNHLLDDLGMDSISCGGSIGFAMELTKKGLLKSDLSFDEHEGISQLLDDIAHRRGLGDDLAEGVKRLSEKYGGKDYAIHVKGLELPAYDPRGCVGQGLEYATTNRGGCHVQGTTMYLEAIGPISIHPHSPKAKPQLVIIQQNLAAAVCCSVFCIFATYPMVPAIAFKLNPQGVAYKAITSILHNSGPVLSLVVKTKSPLQALWFEKFLSAIFNRKVTMGDFVEVGERTFNLERLYNLREGLTTADDTLPERMLRESIFPDMEGGVPLSAMLPMYYKLRGWDARGVPTSKTLRRLKIRV